MLEDTNLTVVGLAEILVGDKFKTLADISDIKEGSIIEVVEKLEGRKSYICTLNGVIYQMPIHVTVFDNTVFIR